MLAEVVSLLTFITSEFPGFATTDVISRRLLDFSIALATKVNWYPRRTPFGLAGGCQDMTTEVGVAISETVKFLTGSGAVEHEMKCLLHNV